ncbi:MAG: DUF1175 family protein [Myxococcota bacterium]
MRFIKPALLVALAFAAWPWSPRLIAERRELPADGRATSRVRTAWVNGLGLELPWGRPLQDNLHIEGDSLGAEVLGGAAELGSLRAGTQAGRLLLSRGTASIELRLVVDLRDADEDGLPDAAELSTREDRAAFTSWFTAIAETQAVAMDDAWAPIHRDCAGLVRFAFKEALRVHDRAWLQRRKRLLAADAPDVRAFHYPELPVVGDRPFLAAPGPFDPAKGLDERFTAAPSAELLYRLNTVFVSRELSEARPGDLLFFAVPAAAESRMHTMIVLGARPGATFEEPAARVVYHTGYDGQVKRVSFEELLQHPDPSWHPVAHNGRFLGVYRFIHLDQSPRRPDRLGFASALSRSSP